VNEELCNMIREAFAGVKLGDGIGLQEAQGIDDYEDAATRARYRADDEKDDWSRISADALNHCNTSLSFFDAEGMRFHLPAYLIADLRGDYEFGMAFVLTLQCDWGTTQFDLLTADQRRAVRAFLLHIAESGDYRMERPDILRALNDYWPAI
jgi:hypothetical protein